MVAPLRPPRRPLKDPGGDFDWAWRPGDWLLRIFHVHPMRPPLVPRTVGPFSRFDPHVPDAAGDPCEQADGRGVIYFARGLDCALAEAFPNDQSVALCPNRRVVWAHPAADVTLLDLSGNGAMKIGAVGTLGSGDEPRAATQQWARAIYEDLPRYDGVRYRGAHQGGEAVAVWDRAVAILPHPSAAAGQPLLEPRLLDRVNVALGLQGREAVPVPAGLCADCRDAGLA